jgi:capsular polysaccharide transport system permease protein
MADAKPTVKEVPKVPSGEQKQSKKVRARKQSRWKLTASFILIFLIPSALSIWYYAAVATDRYAAGASFVVRGLDSGGSADIVSSFTGLTSTGSTTSDSYIIRRYLESPDLLRRLDDELDLLTHYGSEDIDWISRFDASLPFEDFVQYWSRRVATTYDSTTGIVSFEVQAFDDAMTHRLANRVLESAKSLVNQLSERARQDTVQFATVEVERAEQRLLDAQIALREFRSRRGSVDPTMNAQFDAELVASLETQLADLNARIEALAASVDPGAPVLRQLERQRTALETQVEIRRAAIGEAQSTGEGTSTADDLAEFEGLQIEQTFAQQRYASALSSLENARADADRQQRYLAVFAEPFQPDDAVYPERIRNAFLAIAALFAFWSITTLVAYAVRDHLR